MHEAGGIEPVPVWLPPLPEGAPPGVRCVYEFYELVYGLRSWAADDRPVPFACGWVAKKLGIPKTTAWRALKVLVGAGVLEHAGQMPARGKRGTDLYSPVSTAAEESKVVPIRRGS
jgi:hypothetical protein